MRKEIQATNNKQDTMASVISGVQSVVSALSGQLQAISDVLKNLSTQVPSTSSGPSLGQVELEAQPVKSPGRQEIPKEGQEEQNRPLTEELKRRLLLEQEKTRQCALLTGNDLPPINTGRRSAPPGFGNAVYPEVISVQGSPTAPTRATRTPAFNQLQQQGAKLQWEDYPKAYEKDMRAQFLKSMTKGPKMEFPRFDGANPEGWIRQAEKYFQMAGAPPEYKVSLAQMYFVGKADVWLRRAGILKKQYTWAQFYEEILHRFSASSTYDLVDRFNAFKQNNLSIAEYTDPSI